MHTSPPPSDVLKDWLIEYPSTEGNYGHLLLEQNIKSSSSPVKEFREYFESAHLDAREYFHDLIRLDLHPDQTSEGAHAKYPNNLPTVTKKGLFGEVMAGMLTQHYDFIGNHDWKIPIFLFRHHTDVEHYLFALVRDPNNLREVFGRAGSDFIAICLSDTGEVTRFISGESKWRNKLQTSIVEGLLEGDLITLADGTKVRSGKGIWSQVNKAPSVPHGIRQLQKLLIERDPVGHAAAINSIDKMLLLKNPLQIPCTNLILIAGNDVPSRAEKTSLIPWNTKPVEYLSKNDLQVVELILVDGETLINGLYASLWENP